MTFAQWRNGLTMYFSECIPVTRCMTVCLQGPWLALLWTNYREQSPWDGVVIQHIPVFVDANPYTLYLFLSPFFTAILSRIPTSSLHVYWMAFLIFYHPYGCYMSYPSHHPWIGHCNICWRVQFMQFFPSPVTFLFVCRKGYLHNFP
jgi:hypothetical protein